ncbi:MAG: EamA family transporter [Eubacteriales bacterium]|nr:EamA family transporter [Eubacteriales bacterium]
MTTNSSSRLGIGMMLCASLLFSTGGLLCKMIPWSPLAINGVRSLLSLAVFALFFRLAHHKLKWNRTVFLGALSTLGVTTLYIMANKLTTAANAIILQYTAPIWIILFMALWFHVRPTKPDLITAAVVFAGILCFFLDSLAAGSLLGNLCAIFSGMFYGILFLLNQFPDGDSLSSLFFGQVFSVVFLSPMVLRESNFAPQTLCAIVLLGVLQVGIAYICFSIGTKHTNPLSAALINGIEPVLNPVLVAVFWGETITPLSFAGAVIVLIAILVYNLWGVLHEAEAPAA